MPKQLASFGFAFALLSAAVLAQGEEKRGEALDLWSSLANHGGKGIWKAVCEDKQRDANILWEMRDGVLVLKGGPRGYLRTEQEFTHFVLDLEWRRPPAQKPGRGGVLIRMTGEDQIWPKSLEAQLNAKEAGDFWGLAGYHLTGPAERSKQLQNAQLGTLTNLKKTADAEREVGQWNRYEIRAQGETVRLKINGQIVNEAKGCDVVAGKICLTAEGDEIQFRNIRLTPLRE